MAVDPMVAKQWEAVLESLRAQLPSSTYRTWVLAAEPLACEAGVLTLSVGNEYARDRLGAIDLLEPIASEVLGSVTRVAIVVGAQTHSPQDEAPAAPAEEVRVERVYRSRYDAVVRPEQAIPLPRYYLRWVPFLGVDLAWIPVGFRQIAFFRGLAFDAGETFRASLDEIARWSGMSVSNLKRKISDPHLRWFIRRVEEEQRWRVAADGRPHQEAAVWQVEASMPLTPADQLSLERFLRQRIREGLSGAQAIQAAYQLAIDDLLPSPDVSDLPEIGGTPRSVQDVVKHALGKQAEAPGVQKAADALAFKIAGYAEPVYVGYHFLRRELPRLGAGRGWFVQWLRSLGGADQTRGQVLVAGGMAAVSGALGVSTRTVKRWLSESQDRAAPLSDFVSDVRQIKHSDNSFDLAVTVLLQEPIGEERDAGVQSEPHRSRAEGQTELHKDEAEGQSEPHREEAGGQSEPHGSRAKGQTDLHKDEAEGQREPHSIQRGGQSELHSAAGQRDKVSQLNGGGGVNTESNSSRGESSTSSNRLNLSEGGQTEPHSDGRWDMVRLLDLACVHPANRRVLEGASAAAYVSWVLYWASELGKGLVDPVAHAVSRLKNAPLTPMEGAFGRLAALGPDGLGELLVPSSLEGMLFYSGNRDWDGAMRGASRDRLKRVSELLGFDPEDWVVEGIADDADEAD